MSDKESFQARVAQYQQQHKGAKRQPLATPEGHLERNYAATMQAEKAPPMGARPIILAIACCAALAVTIGAISVKERFKAASELASNDPAAPVSAAEDMRSAIWEILEAAKASAEDQSSAEPMQSLPKSD